MHIDTQGSAEQGTHRAGQGRADTEQNRCGVYIETQSVNPCDTVMTVTKYYLENLGSSESDSDLEFMKVRLLFVKERGQCGGVGKWKREIYTENLH